jgi:hypothetical protein
MQRTEERQGDPKFDERESVMRFEIARRGDAVGARARIASRQALPSALRRHPGGDCADEKQPVRHEIHHGERAACIRTVKCCVLMHSEGVEPSTYRLRVCCSAS